MSHASGNLIKACSFFRIDGSMDVLDQDQFQFEASNHGDVLLAGLRHLRDKHQLFDVTLVVDKLELPAHRVVLASCSDYFR